MTEPSCPHAASATGAAFVDVTSYGDACAVLANPALYSSVDAISPLKTLGGAALEVLQKGVPPSLVVVNTDPPKHARFRRVFDAALSPAKVQGLEPWIRACTQSLLDAVAEQGRAEMVSALASPLPLRVMAHLCDIDDGDIAQLTEWQFAFLRLMDPPDSEAEQVAVAESVVRYQQFLSAHIARKWKNPGDDMTSALIAGGGSEPFSESELVTQLIGLFVAGHATVTQLIGNALYTLLIEPDRWRQVVANPSDSPAVIEEVLRFESPIQKLVRTATADTALGGVPIPKGQKLLVSFGAANRDAKQFPEPERFEPGRANASGHLAFGCGTHYCNGATLARLEGRIALEALAARWPMLRLTPGQAFRWLPTVMFKGLERLDVEWF